jgi:hypothetical protein
MLGAAADKGKVQKKKSLTVSVRVRVLMIDGTDVVCPVLFGCVSLEFW